MTGILFLVVAIVAGVIALAFAMNRTRWVEAQPDGNETMREIAKDIRDGAWTFLKRMYKVLIPIVLIAAAFLVGVNINVVGSHALVGLAFIFGASMSGRSGWNGMMSATKSNVRTTEACRTSMGKGLSVSFAGGSVMGFNVAGLGILGLSITILVLQFTGWLDPLHVSDQLLNVVAGFSLGASSVALFARVGGGIYTKAADVGADLVGKTEAGIPEDDPRNPAVIADNVGDNVGDVAGMGADLFESNTGSLVSAMILGWSLSQGLYSEVGEKAFNLVYLPLVLASAGILVSMLCTKLVEWKRGGDPQVALNWGMYGAIAIMIPVTLAVIFAMVPYEWTIQINGLKASLANGGDGVIAVWGIFGSIVSGLTAGALIAYVTEYYTSDHHKPVKNIAEQSRTGAATNIIAGLSTGMRSTVIPVVVIVVGMLVAYNLAGLYGIAMGAVGMLSTIAIQLAVDAFGPVADCAGGIAEMAKLPEGVRENTDALDAVGNTTAAGGKGFAIGSAAFTALALFAAYTARFGDTFSLDLMDPVVMGGLLLGVMMPYLFSSFAMDAVGKAAGLMIEEVRRQFRTIEGLMEGKVKPDSARCVDISTQAAIREMLIPGLLAVLTPVIVGYASPKMLGGLLAGALGSGVLMALFMSNAGGAWDNAKKYVEKWKAQIFGENWRDVKDAAVVGDTVGDPFKDTAGPSLNILIKLMCVVAVVIAPSVAKVHTEVEDVDVKSASAPIVEQVDVATGTQESSLSDVFVVKDEDNK